MSTSLQKAYLALHRDSGIKVGTIVRILRNPTTREIALSERDWSYSVRAPGNEATVVQDQGIAGFILNDAGCGAGYPFSCLEIVGKSSGPFKAVPQSLLELAALTQDRKRKNNQ